jgi:hypothetical protein
VAFRSGWDVDRASSSVLELLHFEIFEERMIQNNRSISLLHTHALGRLRTKQLQYKLSCTLALRSFIELGWNLDSIRFSISDVTEQIGEVVGSTRHKNEFMRGLEKDRKSKDVLFFIPSK